MHRNRRRNIIYKSGHMKVVNLVSHVYDMGSWSLKGRYLQSNLQSGTCLSHKYPPLLQCPQHSTVTTIVPVASAKNLYRPYFLFVPHFKGQTSLFVSFRFIAELGRSCKCFHICPVLSMCSVSHVQVFAAPWTIYCSCLT